jgi:histidyl-tRNA synthetase
MGILSESGTEIPLTVNLGFGRGLEYYTGMVFEVFVPDLGIALNGGGRYDRLIEAFGGEPTPAVGCAPGIDRIVLAMEKRGLFRREERGLRILVIPLEDGLQGKALGIAERLRRKGYRTELEVTGRGLKRALSLASAASYTHAVKVGRRELSRDAVILRDLERKEQVEVRIDEIQDRL